MKKSKLQNFSISKLQNFTTMKQISFFIIFLLCTTLTFAQEYEVFNIQYEFEDINPNEGGEGTEFMANTSDVVSNPITLGGTFNLLNSIILL